MLRKKTNGVANGSRLSSALQDLKDQAVDRRTFLKRSGLTVGGIAAASTLASGMVREDKRCHGYLQRKQPDSQEQ